MEKNVLNTDLTGKVCVVTGAGGAICGMFAEKLAAAGARVVQNAASFLLDGDLVKPVETAAQPAPKTPAGAK